MPEHVHRRVSVTVTLECCRRPVQLTAPLTLVADPQGGPEALLVLDQVAAARAVRMHLQGCPHAEVP